VTGPRDGDSHLDVDVVVLHWRNLPATLRCITSVRALEGVRTRLIVVDNGSGDGSTDPLWESLAAADPSAVRLGDQRASLAAIDATTVLVTSDVNRGYAGGMNLGLRTAQALGAAPYFWLLNNDLTVAPDALAALLRRVECDAAVGLCGCRQLGANFDGEVTGAVLATGGFRYIPAFGHHWRLREPDGPEAEARVEGRMFGVHGAAVFGRRELVDEIGLMDESRFLYFEEQDWARRARRAGYTLAYASGAVVHHASGSSVGYRNGRGGSQVSRYFMARSRVAFTRSAYPWAVPSVIGAQLAVIAYYIARRRGPDARVACAAIVDALRGRIRRFPELGHVSY
jgi:hypothetical protein